MQKELSLWPNTKSPSSTGRTNWTPECADDVPLELSGPVDVLTESDDLFEAVSRAMEHNESAEAQHRGRWAVVVEPASTGRIWPAARLCTPIIYKVTAIWWPDGWEPDSPLDVPNCVWQAQGPAGGQWLSYPQAEATVLGLNRQCMDHPGTTWHVVVAVENEAVSRLVSYDPARHGNHGRSPSHARHPARARRPRQLFALSGPRVPVCQGRLVERDANGFGPSQPGLRHGGRVSHCRSQHAAGVS